MDWGSKKYTKPLQGIHSLWEECSRWEHFAFFVSSLLIPQAKEKPPDHEDLEVFPWLGLKNLFQTFEQQDDEVEIEQQITEIRALLDEDEQTENSELTYMKG